MLARYWDVPYLHLLDDDLDQFYEFDNDIKVHVETPSWRVLSFMQKVMSNSLYLPSEQEKRRKVLEELHLKLSSDELPLKEQPENHNHEAKEREKENKEVKDEEPAIQAADEAQAREWRDEIKEKEKEKEQEKDEGKTDQCSCNGIAVKKCLQCEAVICQQCDEAIHHIPAVKNHKRIPLSHIKEEEEKKRKNNERKARLLDYISQKMRDQQFLQGDPEPLLQLLSEEAREWARRGLYDKKIGQVALWNCKPDTSHTDYFRLLCSRDGGTHKISTTRQQVILFNVAAVQGVFPVGEDEFWEEPLSEEELTELITPIAKSTDKRSLAAQRATRLGYKNSDSAYVRHLCFHGVGGLHVYYFGFRDKKGLPSVVNGDTLSLNKNQGGCEWP